MIYTNLYEETLIKPAKEGADTLRIISGYATAAMAFHHLQDLKRKPYNSDFRISLLVGMCPEDGLSISNHRAFQSIASSEEYSKNFSCSYVFNNPPVHSKIYIWYKGINFYKAFVGSANYTQNAFSKNQRELLAEIKDSDIDSYYKLIEKDSIFCTHIDTENLIKIYNDKNYYKYHLHEESIAAKDSKLIPDISNVEHVTVSLLSVRTGDVQKTGGLNWGQRERREPNQAYIQLSPDVYRSDFFPSKRQHFTVITDDSRTFICVRAQKSDDGQAIETPHNNSLLGEYFRNRLGLSNGAFITRTDLEHYGRTDVVFYKFDNENYYMDFSVKQNG